MRYFAMLFVGLLLVFAPVQAQEEWTGQQWEYIYLTWEAGDDESSLVYLVSNNMEEVSKASLGLLTEIYSEFLNANNLTELPESGMNIYILQSLGERGWELASVNWVSSLQVSILKRPKQ